MLALAVCTDSFAASVSFGAAGIRVRLRSALITALIGSLVLSAAFAVSHLFSMAVKPAVSAAAGGAALLLMGISVMLKDPDRRKEGGSEAESFKEGVVPKLKEVFSDKTKADLDGSKELSLKETVLLGAVLSADSFFTGISAGAGFTAAQELLSVLAAFAAGTAALYSGSKAGDLLTAKRRSSKSRDMSVLSGSMLTALGAIQLWKAFHLSV